MKLGDKILELRKQKSFSQEQLGEQIKVTRQTISNWELGETSPNPEQLKMLSKIFNISIDNLLDNDILINEGKSSSNTERLAGIVIKILKVLRIIIIVFFILLIIWYIVLLYNGSQASAYMTYKELNISCNTKEDEYLITITDGGYFECPNCSKRLASELREISDFVNLENNYDILSKYFKKKDGKCEEPLKIEEVIEKQS